jgi:hypothetical protein
MYGVSVENLGKVSTASWLELVVRILIVDYNNMLYPKRWPTTLQSPSPSPPLGFILILYS